jgi:hypothetical protein
MRSQPAAVLDRENEAALPSASSGAAAVLTLSLLAAVAWLIFGRERRTRTNPLTTSDPRCR